MLDLAARKSMVFPTDGGALACHIIFQYLELCSIKQSGMSVGLSRSAYDSHLQRQTSTSCVSYCCGYEVYDLT